MIYKTSGRERERGTIGLTGMEDVSTSGLNHYEGQDTLPAHARSALHTIALTRHHQRARKDQVTVHRTSALAVPQARRLTSNHGSGLHYANLRRDLRQMF